MQMPEGEIVDVVREAVGGHLCERPDIELSHAVAVGGLAARREEVPGCENGEIRSRPVRFGLRADGGVVAADAVDEVPLLVFNAFAGLNHSDVPIPKIRDGADDELGLTVRAVEPKDLVSGVVRDRAYDMDVEGAQELFRRGQEGGRVMIARHHDDMAAERHDPAEEAVIQLLRTVAWGAGIEHVSGDDQYVNVSVADRIRQPVEEGGKGFVAPAPVEGAPDMPVGRMQYS